MTPETMLALAALIVFAYGIRRKGNRKARRAPATNVLDRCVLHWTEHDVLTMRQLLDGGVVILGRPGSGKTSSSGKQLARGIVNYPNSGGLICSSSPTDLKMWQEIFREAGREDDLILFGPRHPHRFNLTDYLAKLGLSAKDIAKAIVTIGERQDNDESQAGGGSDKFWPLKIRQTVETAVEVVKQATGKASIVDLGRFISSAATTSKDLGDRRVRSKSTDSVRIIPSIYKQGAQHRFFEAAEQKRKEAKPSEEEAVLRRDLDNAKTYWWGEWPVMNDRTRTSVEAGITATLHVFLSGHVWSKLSQDCTITPNVMNSGKWVFCDASAGEFGSAGVFLLNAWRYATQQMVLKRVPGEWNHPICIFADEAGKISNSADAFYLTESRKFGGFSVFLAQSMKNFEAALAGERGKAQAELLLGCFAHKIAHAIGDPDTADWLSRLCGKAIRITRDYRPQHHRDMPLWELLKNGFQYNIGGSEHVESCLEAKAFMHNLKCGGPHNGLLAEAMILRSGEPFASTNTNYLLTAFSQK